MILSICPPTTKLPTDGNDDDSDDDDTVVNNFYAIKQNWKTTFIISGQNRLRFVY